jgi:hypothetical protein
MSDWVNHNDFLCRYRKLCPEESAFEQATDYTMFLHGEEDRLRGLLAELRLNADFQRIYYEYQLVSCLHLLRIWKRKSKVASRAWKAVLSRGLSEKDRK